MPRVQRTAARGSDAADDYGDEGPPNAMTLEQAIQYWHSRMEREPEPVKSFCKHHLEELLMLQDNQRGGG